MSSLLAFPGQGAQRPGMLQQLRGGQLQVIAAQFARATFLGDNRADLARVTTPALVLQCSEDVIAPSS